MEAIAHADVFILLMRAMEEKTRPKVSEFGFVQTTRPVARQWDLRPETAGGEA